MYISISNLLFYCILFNYDLNAEWSLLSWCMDVGLNHIIQFNLISPFFFSFFLKDASLTSWRLYLQGLIIVREWLKFNRTSFSKLQI